MGNFVYSNVSFNSTYVFVVVRLPVYGAIYFYQRQVPGDFIMLR